jgi:hypothetical protein
MAIPTMAAPAANPPWRLRSIVFELVLGADLVLLCGNLRRRCDGVTVAEAGADGGGRLTASLAHRRLRGGW